VSDQPREPIDIPAGSLIYGSGNDGYTEVERDGVVHRVRVTFSKEDGELRVFNTDELVDVEIWL
jgi:hypothetical protein